jgi:hypothetical protein
MRALSTPPVAFQMERRLFRCRQILCGGFVDEELYRGGDLDGLKSCTPLQTL